MNSFRFLLFTISLLAGLLAVAGETASPSAKNPVVVELFTSEGCSSCPPADALLTKLDSAQRRGELDVLVLSEHVDYWDRLGWKDRFSSAEFTLRQQRYAQHFGLESAYTPQLVIDGRLQTVGNDEADVRRKISAAAQRTKELTLALSLSGNKLTIEAHSPKHDSPHVFLAVTESELSTRVASGENGGRTLQHTGVVRELRELGKLRDGVFTATTEMKFRPDWRVQNLRAVVFAQNPASGEIVGAAAVQLH